MKIVVSAVAFSKNKVLVDELLRFFPDAVINSDGKRFTNLELEEYYQNADGIITGLEKIDDSLLEKLPKLKIIAKYGVGLDNIDINACRDRKIKVGWTAGINKNAVAEMTLGLMIMLSRNLYLTSNQLKKGRWNKLGGYSLSGKTVGIIGLGNIGKELVNLLKPFNTTILINDIEVIDDFAHNNSLEVVSKEKIYTDADIITIHTPLTKLTRNMINADSFNLMKRDVLLINTARGGIVNEHDLKLALISKRIAGAAIDVYEEEPPTDYDLLSLENLICTPHIAGNAFEAVVSMGLASINHLLKFKNENYID